MKDDRQKVEWGDDCPICKTRKSIIADVVREKNAVILRCLKCGAVLRKRS